MTSSDIRSKLDRLKGQRDQLQRQLKSAKSSYIQVYRESLVTEEARMLIQKVAQQTQDQLRYHITEIGSTALEAVFGEGIELGLSFREDRGKTVADLKFLRGEERVPTDPTGADGGGACDIASGALRASLWVVKKPRTRALMVEDEPLKNINDPSREMHRQAAEMKRMISKRLPMQFVVVTMVSELADVADKVLEII